VTDLELLQELAFEKEANFITSGLMRASKSIWQGVKAIPEAMGGAVRAEKANMRRVKDALKKAKNPMATGNQAAFHGAERRVMDAFAAQGRAKAKVVGGAKTLAKGLARGTLAAGAVGLGGTMAIDKWKAPQIPAQKLGSLTDALEKIAKDETPAERRRRREYYMRNREQLLIRSRQYRMQHRAEIARKKKRYRREVKAGVRKQRRRVNQGSHSYGFAGFR